MSEHGSTFDLKLNMYNMDEMKSISGRDLRHHRPEVETVLPTAHLSIQKRHN
jgi:hypothetical protein